jgi:hypothetical protein
MPTSPKCNVRLLLGLGCLFIKEKIYVSNKKIGHVTLYKTGGLTCSDGWGMGVKLLLVRLDIEV